MSSVPAMMKAARIHQFGGPELVTIESIAVPQAGPDQVLIRVRASSVNPFDWKVRGGMIRTLPLPMTLGSDLAGDVVAVGANVTVFKVGDSVYGNPGGAFAEWALARPQQIGHKPQSISYDAAATVPVTSLTAWRALYDSAQLQAGQRVLIHAAAGGVGSYGVMLAKLRGAYVIGTASGANEAFVRDLGADEFIDYRSSRFEDIASGMDVVFDTMGGDTRKRSYAVLKPGGVLVSVVADSPEAEAASHGVRGIRTGASTTTETLDEIAALIDAGQLKAPVSETFALDDINQALALSESGHTRGKIVIHISD